MADRELRRVGARPQIFRRLDLLLPLHHLIEEGQTRNETDHRDEPWRARMRLHEIFDASIPVDPGCIFEVRRARFLMALAKTHQRLVRPRIVIIDRISMMRVTSVRSDLAAADSSRLSSASMS